MSCFESLWSDDLLSSEPFLLSSCLLLDDPSLDLSLVLDDPSLDLSLVLDDPSLDLSLVLDDPSLVWEGLLVLPVLMLLSGPLCVKGSEFCDCDAELSLLD